MDTCGEPNDGLSAPFKSQWGFLYYGLFNIGLNHKPCVKIRLDT